MLLSLTNYAYDAAGRMIKEGEKTYEYGWLDKVLKVTENGKTIQRIGKQTVGLTIEKHSIGFLKTAER